MVNVTGSIKIKSRGDFVFDIVVYGLVILFTIIFAYPVLYTLSVSFSSAYYVDRQMVWLFPRGLTLIGYRMVFSHPLLPKSFVNSAIYMVSYTVYAVFLTSLGAYALSHKELKGRNFFSFLIFFTMLFSGGLIPTYLLIRDMGLLDSRLVMIIPFAVSPWSLIIMRTVMSQNPASLEESAQIDGAGYFTILFKIIYPISVPVIATIALFYAVGKWNDFFTGLIYLSTRTKFPLQLIARELLIMYNDPSISHQILEIAHHAEGGGLDFTPFAFRAAVIMFAIYPLLIIYPFVQRYFVKGIMIGGVKG